MPNGDPLDGFLYLTLTLTIGYYIFDLRSYIGTDVVDNLLIKVTSSHKYRDTKLCTISSHVFWCSEELSYRARLFSFDER